MKIKMIEDQKGSQDGFTVQKFYKGKEYNITDWLADVFVNQIECAKYVGKLSIAPKEKTVDEPDEKTVDKPAEKLKEDIPDETTTDIPDEVAEVDADDILLTADGKPYSTERSALSAITKKELQGERIPFEIKDGYGLALIIKTEKKVRTRG